jgi:hypothetical protein
MSIPAQAGIDMKSFSASFHFFVCHAGLDPASSDFRLIMMAL